MDPITGVIIVGGLIALLAGLFVDGGRSGSAPASPPRRDLRAAAPEGYGELAENFDFAAHELLKAAAMEQARLALGDKEGDITITDKYDHFIYEVRDKKGRLIERGEIDDLGRTND